MSTLKIEEFVTDGRNSYQLVNQDNLIVAVVTGLSNEENTENAILFSQASEILVKLKMALGLIKETTEFEVLDRYKQAVAGLEEFLISTKLNDTKI